MNKQTINAADLRSEFRNKKKEAARLRSKLNIINREKKVAFQAVKSLRDKISSKAARIKTLREERDQLTKQVRELKEKRNVLNLAVKEGAPEKKRAEQKKSEILEKMDLRENPLKLKAKIEQLELEIETEVMPFSREQQLTKKIKELKAKKKELEKQGDTWKEIEKFSADFAAQRKQAQEVHYEVQRKAEESQEKHERIVQLVKEVKNLRKEEQPLAEKHLELKVKYSQVKEELDEILKRVNELAKIFRDEEKKSFKKRVKEKTAEVKRKIKKGKKLSTEDILAFQAMNEE